MADQADYTLSFSYPVVNERSYGYDERGRPNVEDNSLANATSQLDGLNRVVRRTDRDWKNTMTKDAKYGFDDSSDSPVSVSNAVSGALETWYLTDPEGLLAAREGTVTKYQYVSGRGEVVQVADAAGVATYTTPRAYDEFGISSDGPTPYGFTGRWQRETSGTTGTIRMGARLYDPVLGRFLQVDPVEGGSANDYEYCYADPINCRDLDGLESEKSLNEAEKRILEETDNGRNRRDGTKLSDAERRLWNRANAKRHHNEKIRDERNRGKVRGQPNKSVWVRVRGGVGRFGAAVRNIGRHFERSSCRRGSLACTR